MMILVNEVIKMTIEGMIAKTVIITKICNERPYSDPASLEVIRVSAGPDSAPQAGNANRTAKLRPKEELSRSSRFARVSYFACLIAKGTPVPFVTAE